MNHDLETIFKSKISQAREEFSLRLEQQRLFLIQNTLLKRLHREVQANEHCDSTPIENLSIGYDEAYRQLSETGKTYENMLAEKVVVDTYSSLEKFLFDCFFIVYSCFPKFLGENKSVSIAELFINDDIERCKKHIIEQEVKSIIQSNHVIDTLKSFIKKFKMKTIKELSEGEEARILLEISWVRNIIIHNNGEINQIYIQDVNKKLDGNSKYDFSLGDSVVEKIDRVVVDVKTISEKLCENLENLLISDFSRLKNYHDFI